MKQPDYNVIIEHYEKCLLEHGDTHRGVDWPDEHGARIRYEVMLGLVRGDSSKAASILDFGCGTSSLYTFLRESGPSHLAYSGLDLSEEFCAVSRYKYPDNEYFCFDVIKEPDRLLSFDYIVMNGVFTEKRELSFEAMFDYFRRLMILLFNKANIGVAFNVMSTYVDWERDDLFHLPLDLLLTFLRQELSRHITVRCDYGLYEYTVYVYKDPLHG